MGLYSTERVAAVQFKRVFAGFGGGKPRKNGKHMKNGQLSKTKPKSKPKPKVKATQSTTLILALIRFIVSSHPLSSLSRSSRLASPYLVLTLNNFFFFFFLLLLLLSPLPQVSVLLIVVLFTSTHSFIASAACISTSSNNPRFLEKGVHSPSPPIVSDCATLHCLMLH
jgi:hypothetical protein